MDLVRDDLAALYPQFGVRVAHAGLTLVAPTDAELLELAAIVAEPGGILDEGRHHFLSRPMGDDAAARVFLEWSWRLREFPTTGRWRLPLAVLEGGRALGLVVLAHEAEHPAGTVHTSSWLARADQGRGLGRRVRLMLLELAFGALEMTRAVTSAADDNHASLRVSRRCGYRETDRRPHADGTPEIHLAVTPGLWRRRRLADVVVEGVEPFAAAISPPTR